MMTGALSIGAGGAFLSGMAVATDTVSLAVVGVEAASIDKSAPYEIPPPKRLPQSKTTD